MEPSRQPERLTQAFYARPDRRLPYICQDQQLHLGLARGRPRRGKYGLGSAKRQHRGVLVTERSADAIDWAVWWSVCGGEMSVFNPNGPTAVEKESKALACITRPCRYCLS